MLFDLLYGAVLVGGAPYWLWKGATDGRYRHRFFDRLALYPRLSGLDRSPIWIHAASVGEVRSARALSGALRRGAPDLSLVVTTQSVTGWHEAARLFPEATVLKFPLDFSAVMEEAFARIGPSAVLLVESEFWPNLARIAERSRVPLALASGSISERSFTRFSRARFGMGRFFRSLSAVCAQTDADAGRFRALGVLPERIRVTGNPKFDAGIEETGEGGETSGVAQAIAAWRSDRFLFVAGSTHAGEEAAAVAAWEALGKEEGGARGGACLVVAPRHPERFAEVIALLAARGIPFHRISTGLPPSAECRVVLLDTMGDLAAAYGCADAAFVGGSLAPVGGHNVLEPAARGVPVLWGPHVSQFFAETTALKAAGGGVEVADAKALARELRVWAEDPAARKEAGARAAAFVAEHRGAAEATASGILALLAPWPDA